MRERFDVPGAGVVAGVVAVATVFASVTGSAGAWLSAATILGLAAGLAVLVFGRVDAPAPVSALTAGTLPPPPPSTIPETPEAPPHDVVLPEAASEPPVDVRASEGRIGPWRLLTAPKLGTSAANNEDAVAVAPDGLTVAVADGASSAFASSMWSRALVDACIAERPDLTTGEGRDRLVAISVEQWTAETAGGSDWWSDEARSRGSFAALASLTIDATGAYTAVAVGDTCLFVYAPDLATVSAFPITAADDFNLTPPLVGTTGSDTVEWLVTEGTLTRGQIVLLATDGLAQWLLADSRNPGVFLTGGADIRADLLDELRRSGEMVNDDVAAVWREW